MNQQDFMLLVLKECQQRTYLTYNFSIRGFKRFKFWFYRQCKKHYSMDKYEANNHLNKFLNHYNITINGRKKQKRY